jgi:hypothetical protein
MRFESCSKTQKQNAKCPNEKIQSPKKKKKKKTRMSKSGSSKRNYPL